MELSLFDRILERLTQMQKSIGDALVPFFWDAGWWLVWLVVCADDSTGEQLGFAAIAGALGVVFGFVVGFVLGKAYAGLDIASGPGEWILTGIELLIGVTFGRPITDRVIEYFLSDFWIGSAPPKPF